MCGSPRGDVGVCTTRATVLVAAAGHQERGLAAVDSAASLYGTRQEASTMHGGCPSWCYQRNLIHESFHAWLRTRPTYSTMHAGAGAAVIAFSTTDRASFDAVPTWRRKVAAECGDIAMVLVQNKVDLLDRCVAHNGQAVCIRRSRPHRHRWRLLQHAWVQRCEGTAVLALCTVVRLRAHSTCGMVATNHTPCHPQGGGVQRRGGGDGTAAGAALLPRLREGRPQRH